MVDKNGNNPFAGIFIFSKEIKNDGKIKSEGENAITHIETDKYSGKGEVSAKSTPGFKKVIKRGTESWAFIYIVLGLLITIEVFIISILPDNFNWLNKIVIFLTVLSILIWLCLFNAWFQNKLIGLKIRIEEAWRKI